MSQTHTDLAKNTADGDTSFPPKVKKGAQVKGWLQIILVVGVLAAGLLANALLSSTRTAPRQKVSGSSTTPVEVTSPNIENIPFKVTGSGVIQSRNAIDLSPQVSGLSLIHI